MTVLTTQYFTEIGFDTSVEPYKHPNGDAVYKNYVRDRSGNFDGYILQTKAIFVIDTVESLREARDQAFLTNLQRN